MSIAGYKLSILSDSPQTWTEEAIGPFMRVDPLYIDTSTLQDNKIEQLRQYVVNTIARNMLLVSDDEFEEIHCITFSGTDHFIAKTRDAVTAFVLRHERFIYRLRGGEDWKDIYVEFSGGARRGVYYTKDDLHNYIYTKFRL